MDTFHLSTVECNISSFSSSKLAMIYLNKYIMKCELKNSEHYKVGDVLHGFKITTIEKIDFFDINAYKLEHL